VLGAAPARVQTRWHREWCFPARAATLISALAELVLGCVGIIDAVGRSSSDEALLPGWMSWLAVLAPVLFIEALCRLQKVLVQGEPIGMLLGLPMLLLERAEPGPGRLDGSMPRVIEVDLQQGCLDLVSPIYRRDWEPGGVLEYRGRVFRLVRVVESGRSWAYGFELLPSGAPAGAERLRLVPPLPPRAEVRRQPAPRVVRLALQTALICLAPARHQIAWARQIGTSAVWLTVAGAGTELLGGVCNLGHDLATGSPLLVLDGLLLGSAAIRLGALAVLRRPIGSLLGLPLERLYRRWVGELAAEGHRPAPETATRWPDAGSA